MVATLKLADMPALHYVVGAHYDTVGGTVGADDNASGVAVMLETARAMQVLSTAAPINLNITFVAFTLEEYPAFLTRHMGSHVFATQAKKEGMDIAGMICLEMVGYSCRVPGCQHYPFPLHFLGYPRDGTLIGIVGNFNSLALTRQLRDSFRQNLDLPVATLTVPFNGWILPAVRLSDHAYFWDRGFRAVMVTDTAYFRNPNYHLPSDTKQTLVSPIWLSWSATWCVFSPNVKRANSIVWKMCDSSRRSRRLRYPHYPTLLYGNQMDLRSCTIFENESRQSTPFRRIMTGNGRGNCLLIL